MSSVLPSPALESTIAHLPHSTPPHATIPPHAVPGHQPNANSAELVGKTAAVANDVRQPQPTAEQKTAGKLRTVKSIFMIPAQMEFFGFLGGGLLGWGAKKAGLERTQAAVRIAAKAPVHAMRRTTLADTFQLPANLFKEASIEAGQVGGKAKGWADSLEARSGKWMEKARVTDADGKLVGGAEHSVATRAEPHIERFGARLDKIEKSDFGKGLTQRLSKFVEKRHAAVKTKHTDALENAKKALETEGVGFKKSISNWFGGKKPSTITGGGELSSIFSDLEKSKTMAAGEKAGHLRGVLKGLEDQLRGDALKGEVKTRAGAVMKHLQKAVSSADALENYGHAVEGGQLRHMVGALGKSVGKVPVFNALLTVGIAAGLTAVVVTSHGESKQSKAAFKKVSDELAGKPDSSFLRSIKAAQKSDKHWGVAKTGMKMAGETAEGAMWMLPGGGGMGMMGAMMLPQMCESLVPGNSMLGALEVLDKSDRNEIALKPSDRIQLLAEIIGGMESVKKNGGPYNRLAKGMAAEMQERGFDYHHVVQVLGDDAAFKQFASDVSEKQKADAAKMAAEVKVAAPATATAAAVNDNALIANDNGKAPATMLAAAPTTRIGVGRVDAQHQGTIVDNRQVAMG